MSYQTSDEFLPPRDRFNPFAPGVMDSPYPWYQRLRTHDPVHFNPDLFGPGHGAWFLSRYQDVLRSELDTETFVRGKYGQMCIDSFAEYPALSQIHACNLFFLDPPRHTAQHNLIRSAFTRGKMEQWRPRIQAIAATLLDTILAGESSRIEFIEQFCIPFPLTVFAELLGIPPQDRMMVLQELRTFTRTTDPVTTEAVKEAGDHACGQLIAYFTELIAARRRDPRSDLLSSLVQQVDRASDLSVQDLLSLCVTLPVAGYENIANALGLSILALFSHPEQLTLLSNQPDLIENVVDETIRFYAPTQFNLRSVTRPVQIGGTPIPVDSIVFLLLGSANRDEAVFPNPDLFDLRRSNSQDHLAFGKGKHYCLGDPLTHIEVEEGVRLIISSLPKLCVESFKMAPTRLFWGPQELYLSIPHRAT